MISKKLLKAYGCKTISEYYDVIVASRLHGQTTQCSSQFKALGPSQRIDFLTYLLEDVWMKRDIGSFNTLYLLLKDI